MIKLHYITIVFLKFHRDPLWSLFRYLKVKYLWFRRGSVRITPIKVLFLIPLREILRKMYYSKRLDKMWCLVSPLNTSVGAESGKQSDISIVYLTY